MKKRYSIVVFFIIATLKIFGQVNDTISIVTLDGIKITYFQSALDNTFSHSNVTKNGLEITLINITLTESIGLLNNWIETTYQHIWTKKTSEYKLNFLDKRVINEKMSYFSAVNTSQLEESIFHKRVLDELLVLFNIKEEIIEAPTYKISISNPDDFLPIWNKAVTNDISYAPNVKFRNDTLFLEEYQISDLANFISEWYGIYVDYIDFPVGFKIGFESPLYKIPIGININETLQEFSNYLSNKLAISLKEMEEPSRSIYYYSSCN